MHRTTHKTKRFEVLNILLVGAVVVLASGCAGSAPATSTASDDGAASTSAVTSDPEPEPKKDDDADRGNAGRREKPSDRLRAKITQRAPYWVTSGGDSRKYPDAFYIVGFAMAVGEDAVESSKASAAGDLANRVQVRIEHELSDVSAEKNGKTSYHVASITRMTSDVRIRGIDYEIYQDGDKCYALAYVSKKVAVLEKQTLRDRAMKQTRACLAEAAAKKRSGDRTAAAEHYETCRKPVAEALENDALIRVVHADGKTDQAFFDEILSITQTIDAEVEGILREKATSLRQAVETLAMQLKRQGTEGTPRWVFSPLNYGTTNFSSPFGQQVATDLESAVARLVPSGSGKAKDDLAVKGFFIEEGDLVRISVTAKSVQSGALAASAETTLPRHVIPSGLPVKPHNFDSALSAGRLLAEGELIEGDLRLEIWCDKGRRGAVYSAGDAMRLFMKVNQPAYVRLVYVLENGAQVPIDQGYYIDSSKVNMAVEYPDEFEVVPPFGIEHIHATAFTKKPTPLPTAERLIDGTPYEVVAEGFQSMIRHRGIKRKSKDKVSETMLSVTTMPR